MTATLAFPQSLAEKYRPRTIAGFAGLEKQRKILSKLAVNPYSSAWLFVGPPGVGKTSMALALAEDLKAELHHIPSQKCNVAEVEEVIRQCWYVPRSGGFHLVLVDEADAMSNAAQLAFLSKLDATAFPPQTIFVFTCNGTDRLEPRFLSRCRVLEFSSYGLSDAICEHLARVWSAEGGNGDCPNLKRLVGETHNNVRESLMRLELELMGA